MGVRNFEMPAHFPIDPTDFRSPSYVSFPFDFLIPRLFALDVFCLDPIDKGLVAQNRAPILFGVKLCDLPAGIHEPRLHPGGRGGVPRFLLDRVEAVLVQPLAHQHCRAGRIHLLPDSPIAVMHNAPPSPKGAGGLRVGVI